MQCFETRYNKLLYLGLFFRRVAIGDANKLAGVGPVNELLAERDRLHVLVDLPHQRPRGSRAARRRYATVLLGCKNTNGE